jgi:hypothetical protein
MYKEKQKQIKKLNKKLLNQGRFKGHWATRMDRFSS